MCLAIPAKIIKIENGVGTLEVDGVQTRASLVLIDGARVNGYVLLHAGFAICALPEGEPTRSLEMLREMAKPSAPEPQNMPRGARRRTGGPSDAPPAMETAGAPQAS